MILVWASFCRFFALHTDKITFSHTKDGHNFIYDSTLYYKTPEMPLAAFLGRPPVRSNLASLMRVLSSGAGSTTANEWGGVCGERAERRARRPGAKGSWEGGKFY